MFIKLWIVESDSAYRVVQAHHYTGAKSQCRKGESVLTLLGGEYPAKLMSDEKKIQVPEGSDGQQQYWPGDKQLQPGETTCPDKDKGTREHEEIKIPEVR